MIQRVQSILLFFSALCMLILLFVPIWEGSKKADAKVGSNEHAELDAFSLKAEIISATNEKSLKEISVLYIAVIAILSTVFSSFAIFQYRNRILQMKIGMFNTLVIIGTIGCIFLGIHKGKSLLSSVENDDFQIGFLLPVIALILNVMANRYIRKDEKLVKSSDRFR